MHVVVGHQGSQGGLEVFNNALFSVRWVHHLHYNWNPTAVEILVGRARHRYHT